MFKHIGKVAAAVSIVLGSNAYCSDDAVKIFNPNPQKDDVVIPMPCDRYIPRMILKKSRIRTTMQVLPRTSLLWLRTLICDMFRGLCTIQKAIIF